MNKKSFQIIVTILSINILFTVFSYAQEGQKTITVLDDAGNAVPGALVSVGEGSKAVKTNESGEFMLPAGKGVPILVEAEGFETQLINASGSVGLEKIVLNKAPYQMGEKDRVAMPFGTFKKRQLPGAVTVLTPSDILGYDFTDVEGALRGRVPGMYSPSNIRGMNEPLYVIDGIPRPIMDINLQQVEQITVIKDLSAAMLYGSQASNGVVLITTRRGEPLKKSIHFTAENGFSKPISYPNFLGAGQYMELYNEALANDGLSPKFTPQQISGTKSGTDPVRYPDENYYNSTYLKDWTTYQNIVGEASGGNDVAQYYLNLGWKRNNSLLKIGEGANEKTDRLNMRGNINYKLNDAISLRFDGAVIFNISNGPRYTGDDFWGLSSTLHPEYYSMLIPSGLITDPALLGAAKLVDGQYVLGGTSEYLTNIYGELTRNGPRKNNDRLIQISTGLDFDLASITKGLKASVYFSFDMYNMFTTDILNSYAVYNPTFGPDSTTFSKYGVDAKVDEQTVTNSTYNRRTGIYGTLDYSRIFGNHEVKVTALSYRDQYSVESVLQPTKHLQFGLRANYMYRNKITAELTGVMAGSTKFFETEPYAFSPGIGLGWILSEESFIKDNTTVNFLKIKTNWAIINTDEAIQSSYMGRDYYDAGSVYRYNHRLGDNAARMLFAGNPDLTWEKLMNFNLGFESMLLDYKLGIEASWFYNKRYDLITQRTNSTPSYFTSLPFENYGSNRTQGVELGLNYKVRLGDVAVNLGTNIVYSVPKVLEADVLNYPEAYRDRIGKPTDAIFGFVALGLFKDQADINASLPQTFGEVQPGDIKYQDLNGDNVIDNNDQKMIGNSGPRLGYGLNLDFKYKALELFVLATGQTGQNTIFDDPYYWIYGNRKYSEIVLDRWTPATAASASYPRLSSKANANNFVNSTYWLYDNDWLKLQTVQLTYTLQNIDFAGLNQARFFARANNLLKVSKIKDKTDLNIGSAPQVRSFSLGLALQF